MKKILEYVFVIAAFAGLGWGFYYSNFVHDQSKQACFDRGYVLAKARLEGNGKDATRWYLSYDSLPSSKVVLGGGIGTYISGEVLMAKVCREDLKVMEVLYDEPYFGDYTYVNITSTEIRAETFYRSSYFKYVFEGEEYKRFFTTAKGDRIDESKQYLVKVNESDPRVAYIYLDSMVSNVSQSVD